MQITEFKISNDQTKLNLTITNASSVISLYLWKNNDYKDFTKAIDLSSKLSNNLTQIIEISLAEIDELFFDGVYFIEAETSTELALEFAYSLTKYRECILDKLLDISQCDECLKDTDLSLINAHSFLKGLEYALEERFIEEILLFINTLNKYCSNECKSCKSQKIINNNTLDVVNPDTIIVKVDGGNR